MKTRRNHPRNLLLMLCMAITSCGPARHIVESQTDIRLIHIRDSVYVHDTLVLAPIPSESSMNVLSDSDTSYLCTSIAESEAFVKDGQLHHSLRNRQDVLFPAKVTYVDRARTVCNLGMKWHESAETIEVEKQLTRWQKFILALGHGAFALLCMATIMLIIRMSSKIKG